MLGSQLGESKGKTLVRWVLSSELLKVVLIMSIGVSLYLEQRSEVQFVRRLR
jgi:hypothetical protein